MTKVFNVKENKNDAVHNNAENMHLVMHALYLNFLSYNTKRQLRGKISFTNFIK